MTFLSKSALLAASVALAACSLYESSGRKSLENSAFDIAAGTATLVGCQQNVARAGEVLRDNDQAKILGAGLFVSVVLKQNPTFTCDYQVISSDAATSHIDDLLNDTVSQQKNH
jgi:hypothetical protein